MKAVAGYKQGLGKAMLQRVRRPCFSKKQAFELASINYLGLSGLFTAMALISGCIKVVSLKRTTHNLKPQVTTVKWDDRKELPPDYECSAAGPKQGILNSESRMYKTIDIRKGTQAIEEKATYQDEDIILTVIHGGCAHFGVSYTFDVRHQGDVGNHDLFLDVVLTYLRELKTKVGKNSYIPIIQKVIREERKNTDNLKDCKFDEIAGYSHVLCSFERISEQRVSLRIAYSIVL